jgi:FolB domain-containing protein
MNRPGIHSDRIEIKDLLLRGLIGINSEERRDRQDLLINVVMWSDFHTAATTDNVNDTVNYRTITKSIIEHVENSQYYLVETLAERIAEICLQDAHVQHVQVSVDKPGALRFARSVGVCVERSR